MTQTSPRSSAPQPISQAPAAPAAEYKTPISRYVQGDYDGSNRSGWEPATDGVIVLPDKPLVKTDSGILIPETASERHAMAAESGTLVAIGPDAFVWNSDRTRRLEGKEIPKPGDRVVMNRYAGIYMHGDDGQKYMIMVDHSVKAWRRPTRKK